MVRGDSLDEQYTYLSVKIKRCNPRITPGMCKSEQDINNLVNQLEVQLIFTNSNFDQRDLYDPVK